MNVKILNTELESVMVRNTGENNNHTRNYQVTMPGIGIRKHQHNLNQRYILCVLTINSKGVMTDAIHGFDG